MTGKTPDSAPFGPAMHVWYDMWRKQCDQSMKLWAWWAQFVPHLSSTELAAEAEAMKTAPEVGEQPLRSQRSGTAY